MYSTSPDEVTLNRQLLRQPSRFNNRFTTEADRDLREFLFRSLAAGRHDYLTYFFPSGPPLDLDQPWSLRIAQGAKDGAEYTEAARGGPCGHIFRSGESTYHCKTCAADETCVLCAKCFSSSDHEGHTVFISVSPGNSGCCDCGDPEAWRKQILCSIHTLTEVGNVGDGNNKEKGRETRSSPGDGLPADLVRSIRMTISRAINYLCDVLSCSPEQMRLQKNEAGIIQNEILSRLSPKTYGEEPLDDHPEFVLVLWNDEKHTIHDVQNQVARACSTTKSFGFQKAMEVNDIGRSCVHFSRDVSSLVQMAEIIEQLKVTVTIRSARDTFREQMCAAIIDWLADISGCSVGRDGQILHHVVCEELLQPWTPGSRAINKNIGQAGIDDHEEEENEDTRLDWAALAANTVLAQGGRVIRLDIQGDEDDNEVTGENDNDNENEEDEEEDYEYDEMDVEESSMDIPSAPRETSAVAEMEVDYIDDTEEAADVPETTLAAAYQAPPPPPPPTGPSAHVSGGVPTHADGASIGDSAKRRANALFGYIPQTPHASLVKRVWKPSKHWLEKPIDFRVTRSGEPSEDLWQKIRLDLLILYDLRLWKTLRTSLRHLYITTVVTIPRFKRILGLRFAALYTTLAQLYLIADREPDHSIINLSVQMLTTPSITQEVVERGNFLSNLMAILYTFLTSRQVGFPEDVNPKATLAFDAGAVTNRRMFHFFMDLRWLCQSDFIKLHMRTQPRYLLQFVDLVKLHQGVCPNIRAVGAHIEYEPDTWISASMIVKEINKLCKQIAASFECNSSIDPHSQHLQRAIRTVAQTVMINSFGYERKRFPLAESKKDMAWHTIGPLYKGGHTYSVPNHLVQSEPASFHHSLHYLLSWLLEHGRTADRTVMRALLTFAPADLKDPWNAARNPHAPSNLTPDELLSAIFEHPLRLVAWLSQMKAGMWVRNGVTLRHQAHSYRSVSNRDVAFQRDLFMLQAGLVLCGSDSDRPGERYLAQMLDRFQVTKWVTGIYDCPAGFDEAQHIDVIEDLFHTLIVALCDRGNILPLTNEKDQHERQLRSDIAHTLCFKPLSFSELAGRVTEKVGESKDFNQILEDMTNYKPPEGLTDSGTFELKPEFIELVDPYHAHYSRNNREEAELLHKRHVARKTGKKIEDVIYEPTLKPITSGLFQTLGGFTATPLFVQLLSAALHFAVDAKNVASKLQLTRIETFLHMVLHLITIATIEDFVTESGESFIQLATANLTASDMPDVASALVKIANMEEYNTCHASCLVILRKMQARHSQRLGHILGSLKMPFDRADTSSPAALSIEERERKKQEALARQARVMAQMKQQQNSFLQNQGLADFGDDLDDEYDDMSILGDGADPANSLKTWHFPSGTCILCQEETDDRRLFGTFACISESRILRATPIEDPAYIRDVLHTPISLDRNAERPRPFGVTGQDERQTLSRGFPHDREQISGPVSTSCGHIMHFSCFELYLGATARRHQQQIARKHPENLGQKEFICPLCKALGNTFLPVIWKGKKCVSERELQPSQSFESWLATTTVNATSNLVVQDVLPTQNVLRVQEDYSARLSRYVADNLVPALAGGIKDMTLDKQSRVHGDGRGPRSRAYSLSNFLALGQRDSHRTTEGTAFSSTQPELPSRVNDLIKAYGRLDESIVANSLLSPQQSDGGVADVAKILSRTLAFTIAAFEIGNRGVGDDVSSTTLVNDLSEHHHAQLRILSETVEAYQAVRVSQSTGSGIPRQIVRQRENMRTVLFGDEAEFSMFKAKEHVEEILFRDDIFAVFVDWLSFVAPSIREVANYLQLFLWAEIVKVIFVFRDTTFHTERDHTVAVANAVNTAFRQAITRMTASDEADQDIRLGDVNLLTLRALIDRYATTFLRKAMIAVHVRYGASFESVQNVDPELPEQQRLVTLLHINSVDDLFTIYASQLADGMKLRAITEHWLHQAKTVVTHELAEPSSIVVPHPAIFELVSLPLTYDALTEEAVKRRCPTTGKEISDPAICLLCGEVFCSQAFCCMKDRSKGGCYQHMQRHGNRVAIFINVRKSMVLFSHGPGTGCFMHAPYLDKHGETDPTLRRHHQLFLNQRRYDKLLRETWLSHLVPTVISRKLEADVNPGGWETL